MKRAILGLAVLSGLAAGPPEAEDAKLDAVFGDYLEATFRAQPMTASALGDHRFDDQLDDLSPPARAANRARVRAMLADLPKQVDYAKLSRDGQIDFEIFRHALQRDAWLDESFQPFEDDPRVYVGYLTDSVYQPLVQSSLPREVNLQNVLKRMDKVPAVVEVARATIQTAARVRVETAIRQVEGAIHFYESELFEIAGQPRGQGELGRKAARIVAALRPFLAFLKSDVLPKSNDDWRIGPELFATKLDLELNSGISAAEVLAEAELEADRVEREMEVVARGLWAETFPGEPVPPDDPAGRRALVARVLGEIARDHGTPETLVADARATVDQIKKFIADRDILKLPEPDRCRIVEMPEFKRGVSVAYLEPAPPLDPQGSSEYAISPPPADWDAKKVESYLGEYNRAMLKVLTIHEGYPGHYVQLEYSNRCPSRVRRVLSSGTFAEGWAVYTERMMIDQGFGGGDARLRLQQLKFYLRAVLNAVLDHRMHCDGMTDAQAMELLVGRGFQTEGEALGKIVRAKLSSCQLSTYFVGRTAFARLRRDAQRERGEDFQLGRFHESALSHGTLPVKYLPELIRRPASP